MADTVAIQPQTHAAQVVTPPATVPQFVAPVPATPQPAPTIAADGATHADQVKKMYGEPEEYYPLYGVTTFAELDDVLEAQETGHHAMMLTNRFQTMVGNIMSNPEVTDKAAAVTKLTTEFTARLKQGNGARKSIVDQVRAAFGPLEQPTTPANPIDAFLASHDLRTAAPFSVWKTKEGGYRWLAVYSNNFRDKDHPPEIISEASHKGFIEVVNAGIADYPELWHWHVPGTAWGKADTLDYVDGFALAAGYVYPGHEQEAEALSQMDDIRVSHGMPSRTIVRSKQDPSIIEFHVTTEISPLPGWAAANPLTGFVIL
jgi:hypothetical protein